MPAEDDISDATPLHLAGTRPAMVPVVRIPWMAMILLIGVTAEMVEIYWKLGFIAVPLWPVALYLFRKDHNALRVLGARLRTAGLDFYAHWFGATSVEGFPRTHSRRFRGIPSV